ncbi:hypothetical protein [Methylobacterium sp. SD21]|uniref:hypothetical protein n=1 Tax=Methylobacterium litchii TaxID=3138810 RepID=UPI00313E5F66
MARRVKAGEDRRNPVNTRIRDTLRERLEEAAKLSDRTLSHEIEERLERSFDQHDELLTRFGNYKNISIVTAIVSAWNVIEIVSKETWTANAESVLMARDAASRVLELVKPDDGSRVDTSEPVFTNALAALGEVSTRYQDRDTITAMAASVAVALRRGDPTDEAFQVLVDAAMRFYPPLNGKEPAAPEQAATAGKSSKAR